MSVVRGRRAREFAQLQAAGWTVVTVSPWQRLRAARQDKTSRARPVSSASAVPRGWAR